MRCMLLLQSLTWLSTVEPPASVVDIKLRGFYSTSSVRVPDFLLSWPEKYHFRHYFHRSDSLFKLMANAFAYPEFLNPLIGETKKNNFAWDLRISWSSCLADFLVLGWCKIDSQFSLFVSILWKKEATQTTDRGGREKWASRKGTTWRTRGKLKLSKYFCLEFYFSAPVYFLRPHFRGLRDGRKNGKKGIRTHGRTDDKLLASK